MTKYGEKILNLVNISSDHMTSEEVFLKLKKEEPQVVLATVYNNLRKLTESEEIIKISVPDQPDRYDKVAKHDHLICCSCGEIAEFSFSDFTDKLESELGEHICGYELKIKYYCPNCKASSEGKK